MSDHLVSVVRAFKGTIVTDRAAAKNGDQVDRQIEDLAVCGAEHSLSSGYAIHMLRMQQISATL